MLLVSISCDSSFQIWFFSEQYLKIVISYEYNLFMQVRMGQLGVIQLYLKLLQSDSMEEQSLGTAGIWILAFCDENKHLINKIHGCMEGKTQRDNIQNCLIKYL